MSLALMMGSVSTASAPSSGRNTGKSCAGWIVTTRDDTGTGEARAGTGSTRTAGAQGEAGAAQTSPRRCVAGTPRRKPSTRRQSPISNLRHTSTPRASCQSSQSRCQSWHRTRSPSSSNQQSTSPRRRKPTGRQTHRPPRKHRSPSPSPLTPRTQTSPLSSGTWSRNTRGPCWRRTPRRG